MSQFIDESIPYAPEEITALNLLREANPWKGEPIEKIEKLQDFFDLFSLIRNEPMPLLAIDPTQMDGTRSAFSVADTLEGIRLTFVGKVSVVTALTAYALFAMRVGEQKARTWAITTFFKVWPEKKESMVVTEKGAVVLKKKEIDVAKDEEETK